MYPGQCGSRMVNKRLISGIGRHERGPVDAREQDSVGRSRLVSNILILDYFFRYQLQNDSAGHGLLLAAITQASKSPDVSLGTGTTLVVVRSEK